MHIEPIPTKKSHPFRQIHLDFHTSPAISGIGSDWNKKQWQATLKRAAVNSVTLFAKCHHGWSYHPTKVGKMHPHLNFDLLRAQYEACKEIGIQAPIYLSAGVDNLAAEEHPEWREMGEDGKYTGWTSKLTAPGFKKLCFHSAYTDYLAEQIHEVCELFPDADGIFLDIIFQRGSFSQAGIERMVKEDLDPTQAADQKRANVLGLKRYYEMTTEASMRVNKDMPVFHNSGHIDRGDLDVLQYFSHLELESLPTGGWGYDHFPISIKFTNLLGFDVVGMTGKFHTTWGEFGGFKHPNALRYECAAMLAFGSKCSVGDQLAPGGLLDDSTYGLIGNAYREVEAKEPWAVGAKSVAEIAILSSESENGNPTGGHDSDSGPDTGCGRVLLEEHFLFDLIHRHIDLTRYKLVILPDDIRIDAELKTILDAYLAQGGKLLLSGESGLDKETGTFAFDIGATHEGTSPFQPDYILPKEGLRAPYLSSPQVVYLPSQRIKATDTAESLGDIHDPWFNRTWDHFCSHQHAPARAEASGYDCGVQHGNILYLAHPVFSLYRGYGAVAYRAYIAACIRKLLGEATLSTNLPSTGRVNLMHQATEKRSILHLLHANTINRGGPLQMSGGNVQGSAKGIEVIEDILPVRDTTVRLNLEHPVSKVTLEPQGTPVEHIVKGSQIEFTIDAFECHQMVVLAE
jgi:hypothetical protein